MTKILPVAVVFLFALGCTEIEYIEVEKLIHDTVTIGKTETFKDRRFLRLDTASIPVLIPLGPSDPDGPARDSIIYIDRIDSIFVERIVYVTKTVVETDTVVVREITYGEVLVVYGGRTTYQVPSELQPLITDFFIQAQSRGYAPPGGLMTVIIENIDVVLQAYSHHAMGLTIIVNGNLSIDQMYIPLLRELARQYLGKEYSKDPTHPNYPFWEGVQEVRYSNRDQHKDVIDKIFQ